MNIQRLNFSSNRLRFLPSDIDNLQSLRELLIDKNSILSLSCTMRNLDLHEIALDWFKYASKPIEGVIYGDKAVEIWSEIKNLFKYLV